VLITCIPLSLHFHQIKPSYLKVNFKHTTLNSYKLQKIKIIHVDLTFFKKKCVVIFRVILKSYIIEAMRHVYCKFQPFFSRIVFVLTRNACTSLQDVFTMRWKKKYGNDVDVRTSRLYRAKRCGHSAWQHVNSHHRSPSNCRECPKTKWKSVYLLVSLYDNIDLFMLFYKGNSARKYDLNERN